MGRNSQIRRGKRVEAVEERRAFKKKMESERNPWETFWKRAEFWIYTACVLLIVAFPFVMKDSLVIGDQAVIHTSKGDIEVLLYKSAAPKTVENFTKLITKGYYDKTIWHRVVKGFVIQGGDPTGTGTGGTSIWGDAFNDEINAASLGLSATQISDLEKQGYSYNSTLTSHKLEVGSLAMANAGPNTNGSQFFIVTDQAQPQLDGKHTVFGKVTKGMNVVKAIADVAVDDKDKPVEEVKILSVELK